MKTKKKELLICPVTIFCFLSSAFCPTFTIAQLPESVFWRISRASNFEFALGNCGMLWGDYFPGVTCIPMPCGVVPLTAYWPRGSFHMVPFEFAKGIIVLAKKGTRYLVSDANFLHYYDPRHGPFSQMVPGRIGDPRAPFDFVFNGPGWRYVEWPDYIVYSSLDYDSSGVDISGNNYNDWPIRLVNGSKKYVTEPLERHNYPPVYLSDEDMFCVFKDSDTRADLNYYGPSGASIPIGIEIQNTVYSWGSGPLKDIVLFQYEIINKSRTQLDSCYVIFGTGLSVGIRKANSAIRTKTSTYLPQPWRNLTYTMPTDSTDWRRWTATRIPPTLGIPLLQTPRGYDDRPLNIKYAVEWGDIDWYVDSTGILRHSFFDTAVSDDFLYGRLIHPEKLTAPSQYAVSHAICVGPYLMARGDTARVTVGFIFADDLPHLLLMDDLIMRMYTRGLERPSAPPPSKLIAQGLDRSVKLSWDNSAESAIDPIVPDSLGKPFKGYRLLRAQSKEGPYVESGRWTKDSTLIYEYLDKGKDIGGLKNNVRYYYRILSFDEGAKLLKLDPMESKPIDGVNAQSVIPSSEPLSANESLERVQVVPNPYMVTHEAQRGSPRLYFNYLPEECTIRIYTIALDLVKTLTHNGGSREEWDLTTEGGQLVASQLLFAYIEATNGKKTIKKFSVVVGK